MKQRVPSGAQLATIWLACIYLIAPHKLGSILNTVGIDIYPGSAWEWLLGFWPPFLAPALCGLSLLLVLIVHWHRPLPDLSAQRWLLLPTLILLPVACIGLIRTTEWDFASQFLWHLTGVSCFLVAIFIHLHHCPRAAPVLLACVVVGTLTSACSGWYQYFIGFAETEAFIQYKIEAGAHFHGAINQRLGQRRVMAGFTYPNVFAAHLLLTTPLIAVLVWRWAAAIEPPRTSQYLLTSLVLAALLGVLALTGSRAAIVAAVLAAIATAALYALSRSQLQRRDRLRLLAAVAAVIVVGSIGMAIISRGRDLAPVSARAMYYRSAIEMFTLQPLTGVGLGEFFPWYMRLKPNGAEETRLPHSSFLFFLSQCGAVGGLAALIFLALPIFVFWLHTRRRLRFDAALLPAVIYGMLGWCAHSLADFDLHVPATLMYLVTMPLLIVKRRSAASTTAASPATALGLRLAALALAAGGITSLSRAPGVRAYHQLNVVAAEPASPQVLIAAARRAADLAPRSPYPHDLLGKIAIYYQQWDLGAEAFSHAIERAPHRASLYLHLAECQVHLGDLEAADKSFALAHKWYPYNRTYYSTRRKLGLEPTP